MNEHSFIRSIHTSMSRDVFVWKISDKYQGGVPDTFYSGPSGYLFIEYKYESKLPKKSTTNIKIALTELQRTWLSRAQSHHHLAYIVLGSPTGVYITDDITEKEITKERLVEESITKKEFISRIEMVCLKNSPIL